MSNAANEEEEKEELTEVSKRTVQPDKIEKRDGLGQPVCLVGHMFTCPSQPKTHRVGPGSAKPGFFYKRKKTQSIKKGHKMRVWSGRPIEMGQNNPMSFRPMINKICSA